MSKYVIKGSIDFSKQEKVLYQRVQESEISRVHSSIIVSSVQ